MALIAPALVLMIASWSVYGFFEKFLGLFAVQMLLQDGGQMLGFVGKMPSTFSLDSVLFAVVGTAIVLLAALAGGRTAERARRVGAVLTCAAAVLAAPASLLWNRPYEQTLPADGRFDRRINRIRSAEYAVLTAKAGPFSALARTRSRPSAAARA